MVIFLKKNKKTKLQTYYTAFQVYSILSTHTMCFYYLGKREIPFSLEIFSQSIRYYFVENSTSSDKLSPS